MPTAQPAEKAVELYNELIQTSPDDQGRLWRLTAELQRLDHQSRGDFAVWLGLMVGYLAQGKVDEAQEVANRAWPHFRHEAPGLVCGFASNLANMYDLDRAQQVVDFLIERRPFDVSLDEGIRTVAANLAFLRGDLAQLALLAQLEEQSPTSQNAAHTLGIIADSPIADLFEEHMRVVGETLAGRVSDINLLTDPEDNSLLLFVYGALDHADCSALEDDLLRRLGELYSAAGRPPGAFIPYLCVGVSPAAAAFPRRLIA